MTLRSAGFVVEAMIGPRSAAVGAPHRIGKRAAALPGSGWEVSLIWPLRFGAFIGFRPETDKGPATACPGPSGFR